MGEAWNFMVRFAEVGGENQERRRLQGTMHSSHVPLLVKKNLNIFKFGIYIFSNVCYNIIVKLLLIRAEPDLLNNNFAKSNNLLS